MDATTQHDRAQTLRERHTDQADGPLLLPNAWDAASALIYEDAGFDAVGTTSAGIAASLGAPDGEHLSRDEMLAVVDRIAHSIQLPVSADIEAGYGHTPEAVYDTVTATIEAGAVGVNLEDGTLDAGAQTDPDTQLVDVDHHCDKIRAARDAAADAGVPVVVNGRTDVFWWDVGDTTTQVERTIERANAYRDAGSDCLFVPGVTDPDTITTLVEGIDGPLNVLGGPGAPPIPELADVGVARVSVGSGPMRATLGHLRTISRELRAAGTYESMADGIPYDELNSMLRAGLDRESE